MLPSLFEEQISHDEQRISALYDYQTYSSAESLSYFPELRELSVGPREYLKLMEAAKQTMTVPVIGSLNGCSPGGWVRFAKMFQESGADAVELNIYFVPTDPRVTSAEVEARYIDLVATVRQSVTIPVAVKIGAEFTNVSNFVARLAKAGADGVVLFNRYLEPDIDLQSLQVTPQLVLSTRHELRLAASLDRDPPRSTGNLPRGHQRRPLSRRHSQAADRWRRCVHDRIVPVEARHRLCQRAHARVAELARRQRLRVGRSTQRQHELRKLPRLRPIGAGQLHESDYFVHSRPLNSPTYPTVAIHSC